MKLLRPGGVYVLAVDYPEDAPRSMVVINTGNETSRGFHTGPTLGDALHAKYVNNLAESIDVPLSGKWETWSLLFRLHDRFPEKGLVRGPKPRPLDARRRLRRHHRPVLGQEHPHVAGRGGQPHPAVRSRRPGQIGSAVARLPPEVCRTAISSGARRWPTASSIARPINRGSPTRSTGTATRPN